MRPLKKGWINGKKVKKSENDLRKKLYFIRHAEIGPQYHGRYIGKTDVSLSFLGIRQARDIGISAQNRFTDPHVWLSPARRCQETWQEMKLSQSTQISVVEDLREVDFGEWEEKSFYEIYHSYPKEVQLWAKFDKEFSFPGGEGLREFTSRMQRLQKEILQVPAEDLVLVTHGGVISSLICLFLGLSPSQYLLFRVNRPSISSMEIFDNGLGILTGLNHSSHQTERGRGEWPG